MGKVWLRAELTDEALIETVGFVRDIAERVDAPWFLVQRAKRIEALLPPLIDESEVPK